MATTWNPADKDATITLSNGNLTAVQSGGGPSFRSVRAILAQSTGKFFFEITMDVIDGSSGWIAGLMTGAAPLNNYPGSGTTGIGWQAHSGLMYYNGGASLNTGDLLNGTQTGIIAVDLGASLWWTYAPTAARWNGNASNNPVTGVGGVTAHSLVPLFPTWSGFNTDQATANFGASAFVNSTVTAALITGGFSAWGGAAPAASSNFFFAG